MTKILVTALPGMITAITAILATYLAAMLSLKRFYFEKRWERKQKAYEEIIEALYDILAIFPQSPSPVSFLIY